MTIAELPQRVFIDINNNGVLDAGDQDLGNILVENNDVVVPQDGIVYVFHQDSYYGDNQGSLPVTLTRSRDTDGDGKPDHMDTDSDNDGCPDAFEGDGSMTLTNLGENNQLTGGVTTTGIPLIIGAGQGIGVSRVAGSIIFADHPSDATVNLGQIAMFSGSAIARRTTVFSGGNPDYNAGADDTISYQRYSNTGTGTAWSAITGQTTTTLQIPSVTEAMSGYQYQLRATCTANVCPTHSSIATLSVLPVASYATEHYRQQSNQTYPSTPSVVDTLTGATGSRVTASPKTFAGWTHDLSHTSSITTGTIDATTGLVLRLYYKKDPNVTGPSRPVIGSSKPRLIVEPRPTPTPSKPIPPTSPVSPTLPKKPTLHPAPSADTVVTTTQDTICSFLKQEDTKAGFDYRYDEIDFSDQNTKDSRYTKAIQGLLNHCLVQGIGDDHSTYGIEKNLTIAEARKIFVRLSLISYSEYKSTDHWSMRYVSAGDTQNLWQHVLLEYGSTEDAISLGDFMNIASTVIARIKKTTPQIIDSPILHTRKITRGEAAIVIAHIIEHMYGK